MQKKSNKKVCMRRIWENFTSKVQKQIKRYEKSSQEQVRVESRLGLFVSGAVFVAGRDAMCWCRNATQLVAQRSMLADYMPVASLAIDCEWLLGSVGVCRYKPKHLIQSTLNYMKTDYDTHTRFYLHVLAPSRAMFC